MAVLGEEWRNQAADTASEASLEGAGDFVDVDPGCAWDFPLSRQEKIRRLILLFETEVERGQSEVAALKREKDALGAGVIASRYASAPKLPTDVAQAASLGLGIPACPHLERASPSRSSPLDTGDVSTEIGSGDDSCDSTPIRAVRWQERPSTSARRDAAGSSSETSAGVSVGSLSFVQASTLDSMEDGGASSSTCQRETEAGESFALEDGEYIRLVRGRVSEDSSGVLADWIVLWTSQPRKVTMGRPHASPVPTFSFLAAPGHEIHGVTTAPDGAINGVKQRALASERDTGSGGTFRLHQCTSEP